MKAQCEICNKRFEERLSHYERKQHHFCSSKCYSTYRKKLPFYKQHAYKGIRKKGESKQIYHRRYVKTHKVNMAHLKARRYAREKGAVGSHTLAEWQRLKQLWDYRCVICRLSRSLTKDHIIPLSKGGTDFIENIQPLCRNCNSKKWKHIYENPDLIKDSKC